MNFTHLLASVFIMAFFSYLPRVLPMALVRKKIKSRYLRAFLSYIPYAVLAAMIIPDVFYSTASIVSASAGLVTALLLACWGKGLLTVAVGATAVVFLAECVISRLG